MKTFLMGARRKRRPSKIREIDTDFLEQVELFDRVRAIRGGDMGQFIIATVRYIALLSLMSDQQSSLPPMTLLALPLIKDAFIRSFDDQIATITKTRDECEL